MNEKIEKNFDYNDVYKRAQRIVAAVFLILNIVEDSEMLKTKIKNLSLSLISLSVNLKNVSFVEISKTINDLEKNCLELMSLLDIASIAGLISKMNGEVVKNEFQAFVSEIKKFSEDYESNKNLSVQYLFDNSILEGSVGVNKNLSYISVSKINSPIVNDSKLVQGKNIKILENGNKRKNLRRTAILDFIKGHNNVSIKDIVPNITGCSEKTVQRELIDLIKEGKITKVGERRWSKYSII